MRTSALSAITQVGVLCQIVWIIKDIPASRRDSPVELPVCDASASSMRESRWGFLGA